MYTREKDGEKRESKIELKSIHTSWSETSKLSSVVLEKVTWKGDLVYYYKKKLQYYHRKVNNL